MIRFLLGPFTQFDWQLISRIGRNRGKAGTGARRRFVRSDRSVFFNPMTQREDVRWVELEHSFLVVFRLCVARFRPIHDDFACALVSLMDVLRDIDRT